MEGTRIEGSGGQRPGAQAGGCPGGSLGQAEARLARGRGAEGWRQRRREGSWSRALL